MTRKEILDEVFQRDVSKQVMGATLNYLEAAKLARKEEKHTGGRPVELWFLI